MIIIAYTPHYHNKNFTFVIRYHRHRLCPTTKQAGGWRGRLLAATAQHAARRFFAITKPHKAVVTQPCAVVCMVRQEGLEPPTFWFVARHSIQLSYWRECEYHNIIPLQVCQRLFPCFFYFLPYIFTFRGSGYRAFARLTLAPVRATLTVTINAMNRFSPVGHPFSESCRLVQGSSGTTGHPLGAAGRNTVGLAGTACR